MLITMVVYTFFASMLGFLLCVLRCLDYGNAIANDKEKLKGKYHDSEECVKGSSTDVIIVGAGVAGAALADILGKPVASTLNTIAGALYKVFSASPDQARKEMQQAILGYVSLGGVFPTGLMAPLSGLNPRPLNLVLHLILVAIYGVGRLILPFPSPKRSNAYGLEQD